MTKCTEQEVGEYQMDIPDGAADSLIDFANVSDFHPDGSQREKLRKLVRLAAFEGQARTKDRAMKMVCAYCQDTGVCTDTEGLEWPGPHRCEADQQN